MQRKYWQDKHPGKTEPIVQHHIYEMLCLTINPKITDIIYVSIPKSSHRTGAMSVSSLVLCEFMLNLDIFISVWASLPYIKGYTTVI